MFQIQYMHSLNLNYKLIDPFIFKNFFSFSLDHLMECELTLLLRIPQRFPLNAFRSRF